nr:mitochondrial pyruvate carrier 2 [Drosophila bipectinata]
MSSAAVQPPPPVPPPPPPASAAASAGKGIHSKIYNGIIGAADKFVPAKMRPLWMHPAGPKTIFFWAPFFKWVSDQTDGTGRDYITGTSRDLR